MESYIGTILPWAPNFAPKNWAFCNGQLVPISANQALFALIGTTYGGDGKTTFALPDLRGRVPVGAGQVPGLSNYPLGVQGGAEKTTLQIGQMPQHTHDNTVSGSVSNVTVNVAIPSVTNSSADAVKPNNSALLGKPAAAIYSSGTPDGNLEPFNATGTVTPQVSITNASQGGSSPIDIRQPYLPVNFIICVIGNFPSRN